MKFLVPGLPAALCLLAFAAQPALAADVTVRVEGVPRTLVPTTPVALPGPAVDKSRDGGTTCAPTSGGSALEAATGGDWTGRRDSQGQRVEIIRGDRYFLGGEFSGRYWRLYVNDRPASFGVCGFTPQQGDEILLFPVCAGATDACFEDSVLDLHAPPVVRPGQVFGVRVDEVTTSYPEPSFAETVTDRPSEHADVTAEGRTVSTRADGTAELALTRRGPVTVVASKGSRVREAVSVCVSDGADGFCGSRTPEGLTFGAAPAALRPDRTAPFAAITGPRDGQVFARRRAPRVLRGRVADDGGVRTVKLRLTRTRGRRCQTWSKSRERLVNRSCGAANGFWFSIGDRADWDYQLARRLPRGRYVLDVNAIDKAFNRDDARRRGSNRVVFVVR